MSDRRDRVSAAKLRGHLRQDEVFPDAFLLGPAISVYAGSPAEAGEILVRELREAGLAIVSCEEAAA